MKYLTTKNIREKFIDFFKKHGHTHVASSSLVTSNDPSLMFVNSGMVQFKDVFTGVESRNYTKAVSVQKSVRLGGKHNDLENIGYTKRHHSFFEMLGNFSFADYFKEEAIYYAWALLTEEFCIDKNRLYVTVFHEDTESVKYWKKIANFTDDRIIPIRNNDNFWSMGDTGPCGPCSEIFYDHGDHIVGGLPGSINQDGDRYIEIWNLVFMQYNKIDDKTYLSLKKPSVDTGMGVERMSAVIQSVNDNYDIDIFREIIEYIETIISVEYNAESLFAYRVIADHLRSSAFLIADGITPSNEGRGYVLRRIIRRCMRHAHQLGIKSPLMYLIVPKLVELYGSTYHEIVYFKDVIQNILKQEEEQFQTTLDRGLQILNKELLNLTGHILPGEVAFRLYDTYGFPVDLTADILKQQNIKVDIDVFNQKMREQQIRAQKSWVGSCIKISEDVWYKILDNNGITNFIGYQQYNCSSKILALIQDENLLEEVTTKNLKEFFMVTETTCFYGESGGQLGDRGIITSENAKIKVIKTEIYLGKIYAHLCIIESGVIRQNDLVELAVDQNYRKGLMVHHSATHILHAAMRKILGQHITQKGSLVATDHLRFDVNHMRPITKEEIKIIEIEVNKIIFRNLEVKTKIMNKSLAIESGAMANFTEKYGDVVRVVSIEDLENNQIYSLELCGGTHVDNTGSIGIFKILNERSIASNIRRVEAVCGLHALKVIHKEENLLNKILSFLNTDQEKILDKITKIVNENKVINKKNLSMTLEKINLTKAEIEKLAIKINDIIFLYREFKGLEQHIIKSSAINISQNYDNLILLYINQFQENTTLVVCCSKEISERYRADVISKAIAQLLSAKGGGSKHLGQVISNKRNLPKTLRDDVTNIIHNINNYHI
ncbi:alanine--tRNA ligase [Rickettsia endosymbiont of Cardiosporidium cionae]|uniref:alanine--tRNA ligase n=1 Tax=Rickettsia endosymbiont of Cardiosporidium cionae TaxID=2777155 RepID=UPI0018956BED|nr:alanine--tRNA ligase [Rickettsia endosymbiont of Cardiosporidium cionae]KAF8818532.1 alanine--tRNA ligase [Rickettsia endosymbiont of Cardiosporidium cionae]